MTENDRTVQVPVSLPTREQIAALIAAVSALEIHGGACGHRRRDPECAYCDDARIAKNARKVLALLLSQPTPTADMSGRGKTQVKLSEPPRIDNIAPGTTFTANGTRWRVFANAAGSLIAETADGTHAWELSDFGPSTIRDVTPPAVTE